VPSLQTFTDIYRYRFVLANLVGKDLKAMYRNMALGFLWSLLNPLVLVVVLSLVWTIFMGAGRDFPSLVLVALIPWNFFSYCLTGCSGAIRNNVSLIKKVSFPRQILPVSIILTHLVHFAIQSLLIVLVLVLFPPPGKVLGLQLLWLPVLVALEIGLVVGSGLLVAGLNVLYRDVQYITDSLLTILFWASPVLWSAGPESGLADWGWLRYAYFLNPLAGILEGFRDVLYFGRPPAGGPLLAALAVTLCIGYLGVRSFWRHEREFADLI